MFSLEVCLRSACEGPFDRLRGPILLMCTNSQGVNTIIGVQAVPEGVIWEAHGTAASQSFLDLTSVFVREK